MESDGYITLAVLPAGANGWHEGLYHFGFEIDDVEEIGRLGKEVGASPRPLLQRVWRPARRQL